jgi:hypothetical protein
MRLTMIVHYSSNAVRAFALAFGTLLALAPFDARPANEPVATGTYVSEKGMLLKRHGADGEWQAPDKDATLHSGDLLIGMAGAVIESTNKAVRLQLQTDYDSPLPLLEPGVILHADAAGFDLNFTLDRGRVDVINQKKEGSARVRIQIWGETWEAMLASPGTNLAVEMVGRWRAGSRFKTEPGPMDVPSVNVLFLVVQGEVTLKHGPNQFAMNAPPGPAQFGWNNFAGEDASPQFLDKLPPWAGRANDPAVKARMEKFKEVRERLMRGFSTKSPDEVMDEMLASDDPLQRHVGVILIGALDRIPRLAKILAESKKQDVWDDAVMVMRHWLGRAPGQDQRLYHDMVDKSGVSPVQAEAIIEFLHGFSEYDKAQPETYQMLIDFLVNDRLALRGLAYWHLQRLVPDAKSIPYDPMASKEEREKARAKWKKRIPTGTVPSKAKNGDKP